MSVWTRDEDVMGSFTDRDRTACTVKTAHLVEWADGRPFIGVDDEISAMDHLWVDASRPGPSLLHRVDPAEGLVEADFCAIAEWLRLVVRG